jgi:hypothetical protein
MLRSARNVLACSLDWGGHARGIDGEVPSEPGPDDEEVAAA